MSKSHLKVGILSVAPVVALAGLVACADSPTGLLRTPQRANLATALQPGEEMQRITLPQDENGVFLLDRVCDVFIGDPAVDPADGVPQRYTHQVVVDVPVNARIKLVGDAAMQESSSKLFTCDARDPDDPTQPVIDPVTLHAAKGDAPSLNQSGVTLDLNGYSITVSPAFGEDPAFENLGITITGDDVTLTNSTTEVSRIFGFGHNIDVEAVRPTVQGQRWDGDGDAATVDWVYNIETPGGFGVRLTTGPALIDQVKSVNLDPVAGQGFEARRLTSGILTVSNSHFEGGTEGVFIREASGVTLQGNYISGRAGPGIYTRQAVSSSTRPIKLVGNTVDNSAQGIIWGRDSRNNNASLVLSGNKVTRYGTCGIGRSTRNTTIAPLTLAGIAAANSFDRATQQTCNFAE